MICSTGMAGGSWVMLPESLRGFEAGAGDAAAGGAAGCLASEGGGGGSGPCCCPVSEEASTGAARINIAAIRLCSLRVRNANSLAISLGLLASGHLLIGPRGTRRGLHANARTHSNYGAFRGGLQTARAGKGSQRFQDFDFAAAAQDFHGNAFVMAMNQKVDASVDQS